MLLYRRVTLLEIFSWRYRQDDVKAKYLYIAYENEVINEGGFKHSFVFKMLIM